MEKAMQPTLEVKNLVKHFPIKKGLLRRTVGFVHAVEDISFDVYKGQTLGLVGESGCGKSTTARTIVRLYEPTKGSVVFEGRDMSTLQGEELRKARRRIQMIFQDPYASLNPRMKIRTVLSEPLIEHNITRNRKELDERVARMLTMVGLDTGFAERYPHEFSGGQRQRIGIARALMLEPSLVICDEPISALDVSVQAQIVNLMEDLQKRLNLAYLFVAHDLSMIGHISDRVAIMYLGSFVELGSKDEIYSDPRHPYTQAFLSAVPSPDPERERTRKRILLKGEIPSAINPPTGCCFHTRCHYATDECRARRPEMRKVGQDHYVACHRVQAAALDKDNE